MSLFLDTESIEKVRIGMRVLRIGKEGRVYPQVRGLWTGGEAVFRNDETGQEVGKSAWIWNEVACDLSVAHGPARIIVDMVFESAGRVSIGEFAIMVTPPSAPHDGVLRIND